MTCAQNSSRPIGRRLSVRSFIAGGGIVAVAWAVHSLCDHTAAKLSTSTMFGERAACRHYATLYDADAEEVADDDALLALAEVSERTGLSKTAVRRLAVAARFPSALEIWGGLVLWRQSDVDAWLADREIG